MYPIPSPCPVCGGEMVVTKVHCRECDTSIEGHFSARTFAQLTPEQMEFVELFIRSEGKIKHMESAMGLSYPTIRKRLHEIIRAMGYEPGIEEETPSLSEEKRREVLDKLNAGEITYEEALKILNQGEES
ncbi:MAG: hypothetical protein B6243_10430 [Anaerolineaceae bacterium 4572_5.2]|nr:MAG: hypothetical protein B6243_10430 [Anaerolineaceae bacterium 4572_5.2]